jgi:hypothetical protein
MARGAAAGASVLASWILVSWVFASWEGGATRWATMRPVAIDAVAAMARPATVSFHMFARLGSLMPDLLVN